MMLLLSFLFLKLVLIIWSHREKLIDSFFCLRSFLVLNHSRSDVRTFIISTKGQTLVEATFVLPVLLLIGTSFCAFAYEKLWTQTVEHILHEALICDKTLKQNVPPNYCLKVATESLPPNTQLLGQTFIYKDKDSDDYYADLKILGNHRWKTIYLSEGNQ